VTELDDLPGLDLYAEDSQQTPFPSLRSLWNWRRSTLAEPGWFFVTTMALAREVSSDPARFSNAISRHTAATTEVVTTRAKGFPYIPALLLNDPPRTPATDGWCSRPSPHGRWQNMPFGRLGHLRAGRRPAQR